MPSLWQDVLTMKRYLALSITMSLACQGEGDVARGDLDQDEVQDDDRHEQSERLNQPEPDAPGERQHLSSLEVVNL